MKKLIVLISIVSSLTVFGATTNEKVAPKSKTETKVINYPNGVTEKVTTTTTTGANSINKVVNITSNYQAPKLTENQKKANELKSDYQKEKQGIVLSIRDENIKLEKELQKDNPNLTTVNKIIDKISGYNGQLLKNSIATEIKIEKLLKVEENSK